MSIHLKVLALSHFQRRSLIAITLCAAGALLVSACSSMPASSSVADTIAKDSNLSTLSKLVGQAGLNDTLKSSGPFTVFAPSNEAFNAVPAKTLDEISKDPERLKAVLTYHVLATKVMAAQAQQGPAKTVQGANLAVSKAGSFVTIDDAMVTKADIVASNGVVHVIDRVLLPPATPK